MKDACTRIAPAGLLKLASVVLWLALNPAFTLAAPEKKYCLETELRPLPGSLDSTACFNSNSPEMVLAEGILLSTFPPAGMKHPDAHLNYAFSGRFDLFSHHVAKAEKDDDDRVLYLGYMMGNPGNKKVRVQILNGASYLSQPDAPFITLPEICLNNEGKLFSGPGDRIANDVMRGKKPDFLPKSISLEPGETKLAFCLPVPVRKLRPALNGRSTLLKLKSSGPVYLASIAKFSKNGDGGAQPPSADWSEALSNFDLSTPRDVAPTPPGHKGAIKYGRVAGVAHGTEWVATVSDAPAKAKDDLKDLANDSAAPGTLLHEDQPNISKRSLLKPLEQRRYKILTIPAPGKSFTYPISSVAGGTFGTGQVESAEMTVRYKDTAYQAHGNYASRYKLDFPLFNPYPEPMNLQVIFQSALKSDSAEPHLCFYENPPPRAFFRGTVLCRNGDSTTYWHLVQKQGDEGAKLAELTLLPGGTRKVSIEFFYPPDATPPQEICIRTLPEHSDESE